ncbi:MAG: hypothetical protein AAGI17_01875 [Planctomycetota bacterium]
MRVLSFDPSSTATGWAVVNDELAAERSGILRRPASWPVYLRIRNLHADAKRLLNQLAAGVDRIVVEVPGKAQAGRLRRTYATPGDYAAAVGVVLGLAWGTGLPVVTVRSDEWTGAREGYPASKAHRLAVLKAAGAYDGEGDPGGDRGDAIFLGIWYLQRHAHRVDVPLHFPGREGYSEEDLETAEDGTPMPIGARYKATGSG